MDACDVKHTKSAKQVQHQLKSLTTSRHNIKLHKEGFLEDVSFGIHWNK